MRFLVLLPLLFACRAGDKGGAPSGSDTGGLDTVDEDGDGFNAAEDCDDADASVNGGAPELCDGRDNDCDGDIDEGVMDVFYADTDDDGFGAGDPVEACEQPAGAVPTDTDCDDGNERIHPGANEVCNDLDDNCDGDVDEGLLETWYPDADEDGFGDEDAGQERCDEPLDMVQVGGDCDDTTAEAHPGSTEVCDEIDNDCDGTVDEGVTTTFWVDADGDNYGDADLTTEACGLPVGYAATAGDCDDGAFDVNPAITETCNGIDDDCDATIDEDDASDALTFYRDADSDGYGGSTATRACAAPSGYVSTSTDCNDADSSTNPGASEYCDGHDDDCDGTVDESDAVDASTWYLDADTDGYGGTRLSQDACNQPSGYVSSNTDCNDLSSSIHPGATETCNDLDDDCDSSIDEGISTTTWYRDADSDGYGTSSTSLSDCARPTGYVASSTDCNDGASAINPGATETCDSIDNDCDGLTDDADSGVTGRSTWWRDADLDGYGNLSSSTLACDEPSGYVDEATDCDDTRASVNPAASESCNSRDDDCDSSVDEGVLGTGTSCPAEDCTEVQDDNPSAGSGYYYVDVSGTATSYYCNMTTDGGGWTMVGYNVPVWGTSYDTTYYNSARFTWNEALFEYASGSVHAHCTYPSSLTGCNNLGFQFASESWGVPLNWGSSICGMSTTSYTSATSYIGGYDFTVDRTQSTDTIRLGTLEGISSCTTSDNPGTAYVHIYVRR